MNVDLLQMILMMNKENMNNDIKEQDSKISLKESFYEEIEK